MKLSEVRKHALQLPGSIEEPHFAFASFRVKGRIFATVPPDEEHVHVFVDEAQREEALALHAAFVEKLHWGAKVVGLRITLAHAQADVVRRLIDAAWLRRAPKAAAKAFLAK